MINHKIIKNLPAWLLILVAVFVSLIFILGLLGWYLNFRYQDRLAPNLTVAGVELSNKTILEARPILIELFSKLDNGIPVVFNQKTVKIAEQVSTLNPDVAQRLVVLNLEGTLENALAVGHTGNPVFQALEKARSFLFGTQLEVSVTVDREAIIKALENNFSDQELKPINASVEFINDKPVVTEEKAGLELNYDIAATKLIDQLHLVKTDPIIISSQIIQPTVFKKDVEANLAAVESFLSFPKTKLVYEDNTWVLDVKQAGQWLGFIKNNGTVEVILDQEKIKQFLTDEVITKVNHDPIEPRLTMANGRASVWQAAEPGLEVELDKTAALIAAWPKDKPELITIIVTKTDPPESNAEALSLGLKEIIGTGISNFAGSPANRRHNIRVGANALHGLLIKPGEEFSLLKALGRIDGSTGYKQELVIKDNKTIPEFGGGLCQIGTTMFRATFNSGLPVTQRRNHSYRVVYYEPAGTDATIYDPAPDYRFVNDTANYILIQARIEGSQLAFDFWGTKDDRKIEIGKPVIYNITVPAPTKIIETPDLKEGEKKCTEKSHNGADAYFDYKVIYPSGEEKKTRFSSHYVPWQAVCLVGAKITPEAGTPTEPTETVTPSATPSVTPDVN